MDREPQVGDRVRIVLNNQGGFVFYTPSSYAGAVGTISEVISKDPKASFIHHVKVDLPGRYTLGYHLSNIEFIDPLTNKEAAESFLIRR